MMTDLVRILRESELSRNIKLRIIDIVSTSQDKELIKDLVMVIQEWDKADNTAEEETASALAQVEEKYAAELEGISQDTDAELEVVEREMEAKSDISNIKKSILDK